MTVETELQTLGEQVADLVDVTDEELEGLNQKLMELRAGVETAVKDLQMKVQAEVTRRANEARLAAMADTMSEEDREALRAYMDAHPPVEVEAPTIDTPAEDEETAEEPAEG